MSQKTQQAAGNGTQPTTDTPVVAKCGSCQTDNAVTHKCCSECGEPLAQAARADYDAALAAVGAFHKANTDLPATVEVPSGDHTAAERVITKARSADGANADEVALIELLIGSQNINSDQLGALLGEMRATRIGLGEFAGLMVKAFTAGFKAHEEQYTAAIAALTARVDSWEAAPGRARSAQVGAFAKSNVQTPAAQQQDDSPRGDVLVKAAIDLGVAKKIGEVDVTLTQQLANAGHSLATIAEVNPILHQRLTAAGLGAAA
jgi:hypothetical protein